MKALLSNSARFLVFTNIWVALCLSVLVLGVARHYGITDCWLFATFAFLGTFATYNFHRLVRNIQFEKLRLVTERSLWQNKFRRLLLWMSLIAALSACVIFCCLPVKPLSVILLGISGVIIFFYAIPVPGFGMLRAVPFLKNLLILSVWIVLICIPLINREKPVNVVEITAIACFTLAQIIPFDIRDLPYDASRLMTIPQIFGKRAAQILASVLAVTACGLLAYASWRSGTRLFPASLLLAVPLSTSLLGVWKTLTPGSATLLEIIWDGSLLLLGMYFYLV